MGRAMGARQRWMERNSLAKVVTTGGGGEGCKGNVWMVPGGREGGRGNDKMVSRWGQGVTGRGGGGGGICPPGVFLHTNFESGRLGGSGLFIKEGPGGAGPRGHSLAAGSSRKDRGGSGKFIKEGPGGARIPEKFVT